MKADGLLPYTFSSNHLQQCFRVLDNGGILIYPSDTLWSLGCDAFDEQAVQNLRVLKKMPVQEAFILLVDSEEMLNRYVHRIHPRIDTLLHYHQRPLTVVYPKVRHIPDFVSAPDGSIAIRIVQDIVCRELICRLGRPLISTMATYWQQSPPMRYTDIPIDIIRAANFKLSIRDSASSHDKPSTLVAYDDNGLLTFLRD